MNKLITALPDQAPCLPFDKSFAEQKDRLISILENALEKIGEEEGLDPELDFFCHLINYLLGELHSGNREVIRLCYLVCQDDLDRKITKLREYAEEYL
jgi:hypothetical protein